MKFILVLCFLITFVHSDFSPDYVSELICPRSNPDFEKCTRENLKNGRFILSKGIPENLFSTLPFDPVEIPAITVDRKINEFVSIKATIKNLKSVLAGDIIIEKMKGNPRKLTGQLRLKIPFIQIDTDYDAVGQLLTIPLKTKGHFNGNFSYIQASGKGNLKLTNNTNGVHYFTIDKLSLKLGVGDGHIKLLADDPNLQYEADLVTNFFNEDPGGILDAFNPIIVESITDVVKLISTQFLNSYLSN